MNKAKLLLKIHREFPELKWKTAKHNTEGWDHYVLILDNKYVFRFPRTAEYKKILKSEISLLDYLKDKVNILIPQYLYVSKDKSFAGYKIIPGIQLKKKTFEKLPEEVKQTIARQMAKFLTCLHTIPVDKLERYHIRKIIPQKNYAGLLAEYKKVILPRLNKKDQSVIEKFLFELKEHLTFPHKVFAHNDVYQAHIILSANKKQLSGIIDFADRVIDDAAVDFGELWTYGEKFFKSVYKYYKGPKDANFIKRSKMYYKRTALYVMSAPINGNGRRPFEEGYKLYKEVFLAIK